MRFSSFLKGFQLSEIDHSDLSVRFSMGIEEQKMLFISVRKITLKKFT